MKAFLFAVLISLLAALPAHAQGVVLANSDPLITIHSNFTGESITLFGNVEPGQGGVPETGPFDVLILVRGPASDRVVRVQERHYGLILNSDEAVYRNLAGFYAVLSSRPFEQILGAGLQADPRISLTSVVSQARVSGDAGRFDPELIRMMSGQGHFVENERGVVFLSPTTFSTRIILPASVPSGAYLAQVMVLVEGELVGSSSTAFSVRTQGFERFISRTATTQPVLYGLVAIFIALATGWLGGVLFRR